MALAGVNLTNNAFYFFFIKNTGARARPLARAPHGRVRSHSRVRALVDMAVQARVRVVIGAYAHLTSTSALPTWTFGITEPGARARIQPRVRVHFFSPLARPRCNRFGHHFRAGALYDSLPLTHIHTVFLFHT